MSYAHSLTIHPGVDFWAFAPREAHRCLKRPRSFKPLHSKSSFLARGLFQDAYLMSFVFCDLAGLLAKRSASRFGKMCDCPLLFCRGRSVLDIFSSSSSLFCSCQRNPPCRWLDAPQLLRLVVASHSGARNTVPRERVRFSSMWI